MDFYYLDVLHWVFWCAMTSARLMGSIGSRPCMLCRSAIDGPAPYHHCRNTASGTHSHVLRTGVRHTRQVQIVQHFLDLDLAIELL